MGAASPQLSAARRSNRLFAIFPGRVATARCAIPARRSDLVPGRIVLPATCSTRLRPRGTYSGQVLVAFTERWRVGCDGVDLAPCRRPEGHTWSVLVGPSGKIFATRSRGATAPQFWR
jgi:hypothetical protein